MVTNGCTRDTKDEVRQVVFLRWQQLQLEWQDRNTNISNVTPEAPTTAPSNIQRNTQFCFELK